jgi:thiol-disulfide isomerase/thioredoxin
MLEVDLLENEVEVVEETPIVYDVYKLGCVPCARMFTILEELQKKMAFAIVKVDATGNPDFITEHDIISVPTLVRHDDNAKFIGLPKKSDYSDLISFVKGE